MSSRAWSRRCQRIGWCALLIVCVLLAATQAHAQCRTVCMPDETPGVDGCCSIVSVDASAGDAALSSVGCAEGQATTASTAGNCCWSNQVWDREAGRCVGAPRCPASMIARDETCGPPVCTSEAMMSQQRRGACCWPGQGWSEERRACEGLRTSCPDE